MESVWDYPRPPALEPCRRRVRVELAGRVVADSRGAFRVLETSHPPTIYVPPGDVDVSCLADAAGSSFCEWKGRARYLDVVVGEVRAAAAAWSYPDPDPRYAALKDHLAFYPGRMERCRLDDEVVRAQPGDFYGGWVTDDITGPIKGAAGTLGW